MNYAEALEYLKRGRFKREPWRNSRPIAASTWLECRDGAAMETLAVRFWNTDIVTYYADGTTKIDTNGHWGPATFARIRKFQPRNIPDAFCSRGHLYLDRVIGHTPEKRIRCSQCHGVWAEPVIAVLEGAPNPCRCGTWDYWNWRHPRFVPGDGYITMGGNPIYQEVQEPLVFNASGKLL